jgi:hypothetical protein
MNDGVSRMRVLKFGLAVTLSTVLCSCNRSSSHEVAQTLSPDGRIEAVLTEINGGATTSFGYDVSVGPKGSGRGVRVATLYGAIRSEQAYGVNLHWANNNVLQVEYLRAKASRNVLNTAEVNGEQVQVMLKSGVEDLSAPPGGMFFNLQRQPH